MILKRIFIKNFGGLQDKTIEFSSGVNMFYGVNEAEKNIVFIFMKDMFFGMPEEGVRKNEFYTEKNAQESVEKEGGTIWFRSGQRNYRLTREFGAETDDCQLFCEDTGKMLDGENETLEKLLGGISETTFDNAVLTEALSGNSPAEMAREIQNKLSILSKSGDGLLDLGRSEQMLKMWRKGYLSQKERGQKAVLREKEKLATELENLENELNGLRGQKGQVAQAQARMYSAEGKEEAAVIEEQLQAIEKKNLGMVIAGALAIIVGIVGIVGSFQLTDEMSKLGMDVCILAAIATVIYTLTARRKLRMEFVKQKKKKAYLQSRQEKLKSSQEDIDGTYEEKLTAFTNLQSEYQEYENETSLPTSEELETQALNLAMDTIGELSRNIYLQKGRKIRIRASRILRELTNGKFMEFYGDEGQRIELSMEDGTVGVEELERGEIEVLYFSIRMAASELLADEKILPVVLDDVFHGKRKESLMAISRWMKKQPRQIILLTKNENVKSIFSGKQ